MSTGVRTVDACRMTDRVREQSTDARTIGGLLEHGVDLLGLPAQCAFARKARHPTIITKSMTHSRKR
jgi:hypothetical protein